MRTFCFLLMAILTLLPPSSWSGQHIVASRDGHKFLLETPDTKNKRVPTRSELTKRARDGLVKGVGDINPTSPPTDSKRERSDYFWSCFPLLACSNTNKSAPKEEAKPSSNASTMSRRRLSSISNASTMSRRRLSSISTCRGSGLHGAPCTTWVYPSS